MPLCGSALLTTLLDQNPRASHNTKLSYNYHCNIVYKRERERGGGRERERERGERER